jgi:hypothetical protein
MGLTYRRTVFLRDHTVIGVGSDIVCEQDRSAPHRRMTVNDLTYRFALGPVTSVIGAWASSDQRQAESTFTYCFPAGYVRGPSKIAAGRRSPRALGALAQASHGNHSVNPPDSRLTDGPRSFAIIVRAVRGIVPR